MSDSGQNCKNCHTLEKFLIEKDKEIADLKLRIKYLNDCIQNIKSIPCDCNTNVKRCSEEGTSGISDDNAYFHITDSLENNALENAQLHEEVDSTLEAKLPVSNSDSQNLNISKQFDVSSDYVYDENSGMYYNDSTGYFYDKKSGLFYIPQKGAYFYYDYEKQVFEPYEDSSSYNKNLLEKDSIKDTLCESVLDGVNSLHLNDENNLKQDFIDATDEEVSTGLAATGDSCSKDWLPPEGSNTTVTDLVREVAEQTSGMSDYIYDERSQMYYSKSTGYFYDPSRKLLYDPQSHIFYLYSQEKASYEFYCYADSDISPTYKHSTSSKAKYKVGLGVSVRSKRKHSKKKQQIKENINDDNQKDKVENLEIKNEKGEDSDSLEEGEILSSDSSDEEISMKENSSDDFTCYPCIRAIVENSECIKKGSLLLITYPGGVIGRTKTSQVCVPDSDVSKVQAEIRFCSESWSYSIEDLGSQNGTFINGTRLSEAKEKSEPHQLKHGDILSLGSCKLLVHIHNNYDTCDKCEPGQVMADITSQEKTIILFKSKEEKEKDRKRELQKLKKKYGLKGAEYVVSKQSSIDSKYTDRADTRRKVIGSDNANEKTQVSSTEWFLSESNKGYQMLKKLGWKEGDPLGQTPFGIIEPISLRPWLSKAGLGSSSTSQNHVTVTEDKRNQKWIKAQERYFQLTT